MLRDWRGRVEVSLIGIRDRSIGAPPSRGRARAVSSEKSDQSAVGALAQALHCGAQDAEVLAFAEHRSVEQLLTW